MRNLNMMTLCDFYKISHRAMYPEGTQIVYSTWTPRGSRLKGINQVVCFGLQAFIKDKLIQMFDEEFFNRKKSEVIAEYHRLIKHTLGVANPETKHIEDLHDLGYLPLSIKALPEGTLVPLRVPMFTIENTDHRFFWLTNYIETLASCELWQPATSATIAFEYRKILERAAEATGAPIEFVDFQGHDFSMRGMSSLHSAVTSGMGHLLSFVGTDTIPAIEASEVFYGADIEKAMVGTSIPATEHSIQCAYGDDMKYYEEIISRVHKDGFVSIVSDGYDFWDVIGRVIPALKKKILARNGKVVVRPDSGDPVKIICGDPEGKTELERIGAVEALWNIFGGTQTAKNFKILNEKIGLIYGDAITLARAEEILSKLKDKGFASCNVVFGVGSYTYQYNTRDTFGFALKSTLCQINGTERQIFKDPKTDDGLKKSQRGRVSVVEKNGTLEVIDGLSLKSIQENDQLKEVFRNGKLIIEQNFGDIKERLKTQGAKHK
jgi:nicotinamide phosphoribosyltransferase